MGYVQFLSGTRDQDVAALNDQASLTLGSGDDAHIRVSDPGVDPQHCRIYQAEGNWWLQNLSATTVIDMRRVAPNTIEALNDRQVFIVGRTFVKFWREKPPEGGGGGGAAAAADPAVAQELAQAKKELEELRSSGSSSAQALEEQRRAAEAAQAEAKQLEERLAETKKELEAARKDKEEAEGARHQMEGELTRTKAQAEADLARVQEEAEAQVKAAKEEAEAEASKAREAVESEVAELRSSLEATQAALEALRSEQAASQAAGEPGRPGDLREALDALEVPDALRRRLEDAVASEVEREVLRRQEGPVVPVRGLKIPGSDRDLEAELQAAKRRDEQTETARRLGLIELEAEELDRLLGMARS